MDELERLIDEEQDTDDDRQAAYDAAVELEQDTAEYAFARAALAGRLAQTRTLTAIGLVKEVERYGLRSVELDPSFRDGAARRMLGTLYVRAPSMFLKEGDSDKGLALLQQLVRERPDLAENQLRLAEAYVETGDEDKAHPHLCRIAPKSAELRADSQRLLADLIDRSELRPSMACGLIGRAER
jgi:tetratricopeptide (TPR) repeat protein